MSSRLHLNVTFLCFLTKTSKNIKFCQFVDSIARIIKTQTNSMSHDVIKTNIKFQSIICCQINQNIFTIKNKIQFSNTDRLILTNGTQKIFSARFPFHTNKKKQFFLLFFFCENKSLTCGWYITFILFTFFV